jgi:hypothetical protein
MSKKDVEDARGCPPNAFYDKVLQLRSTRPDVWQSLAPATRLTALEYERQRRQAEQEREIMK